MVRMMDEKIMCLRTSIELSPQLSRRLDEISLQHGIDKASIIQRAFALYDVAVAAKEKNERVGLVDKDGKILREIVGFL